jgi:EAL domain-containing protein (putative c-di-GMP-specific phosphodiesterase class I)
VEQALAATGTKAVALEFEITEGAVMRDAENAVAVLKRLSAMGIRLAMDDFGTGTSSLSVLKRLPVDSIKIDQSFIADLGSDAGAQEIVRAVISMGHALGRRIIAEGVESSEQVAILERLGCDEIQGYVLSQPLPSDQLAALLAGAIRL